MTDPVPPEDRPTLPSGFPAALPENIEDLLAEDTPWPLRDVLERLASAASHLLVQHGCDCRTWELYQAALDQARRILGVWKGSHVARTGELPPFTEPALSSHVSSAVVERVTNEARVVHADGLPTPPRASGATCIECDHPLISTESFLCDVCTTLARIL